MKKILLIIASALLLLTGCKQGKVNSQELFNNYAEELNESSKAINEKIKAIEADTTLTQEQVDQRLAEFDEEFSAFAISKAELIFDKYPADSVSAMVLRYIASILEPSQIKSYISNLKSPAKDLDIIQSMLSDLKAQESTAEGQMFTDFTITQPDGSIFNLSDIVGKGKYVLVDFWSWWCGPCKAEIPNLINVYNRFHGDKFDMLSVGVWERGTPEKCTEVAAELGVCWNQTINGGNIPTDCYGIEGIPHIILFGPDGTILKRDLRGSAITTELEKYL